MKDEGGKQFTSLSFRPKGEISFKGQISPFGRNDKEEESLIPTRTQRHAIRPLPASPFPFSPLPLFPKD